MDCICYIIKISVFLSGTEKTQFLNAYVNVNEVTGTKVYIKWNSPAPIILGIISSSNEIKDVSSLILSIILRETEKEITINAPWGNIAGLSWGNSSNPPVLLVPGRMEPCSGFRPLVLKLPENLFYVTIDLPGSGFSDHFPKGLRFTTYDFFPTITLVQRHFNWTRHAYIGHSLGASIGKYFNMAYPGRFTCIVDLDPIAAYHTVAYQDMASWYKDLYADHYTDKTYKKHTGEKEKAPKYTYEQVKERLIKAQGLTEEAAEAKLERFTEPTEDGLYRLTYDQRMKSLFTLPFTAETLKDMFTRTDVPTLAIICQDAITNGELSLVPFATDESAWPNKNYKVKIVPGNHDVHVNDPGCMADDISKFLRESVKWKL